MMTQPKEKESSRWLFLNSIAGYIAMWAVRQSPYHNPDGLNDVISQFNIAATCRFDKAGKAQMTRQEVKSLLKEFLWPIPQFQKWNERKNGNQAPYGFCSRYDQPSPDNDFIDLDALTGNVVRELFRELDRDFDFDQDFDRRWKRGAFGRWLTGVRYKLFPTQPSTPENPISNG